MNNFFRMPLYIQIENLIEQKISAHEFLPGQKLPSERTLAEMYGVNRMTVKRALSLLVEQGKLTRKQGSGTYVNTQNINDHLFFDLDFINEQSNVGITEVLEKKGIQVQNKVIGTEVVSASRFLSQKLNLNVNDPVFILKRIREYESDTFAIEYNYIPYTIFKNANEIDFKKIGLYDYMQSCDHQPLDVLQKIQLIHPLPPETRLMNINEKQLIYYIQYISSDSQKNIVEYTESYLNPDKTNLKFTINHM